MRILVGGGAEVWSRVAIDVIDPIKHVGWKKHEYTIVRRSFQSVSD